MSKIASRSAGRPKVRPETVEVKMRLDKELVDAVRPLTDPKGKSGPTMTGAVEEGLRIWLERAKKPEPT